MTAGTDPTPGPHARAGALAQLLLRARRRQRTADALWGLSRIALPAAVTLVAVGLVLVRRFGVPPLALWAATAPVPLVVAWAWLRPLPLRALLRRIDRHHRLDDRLGSALEFSRSKPPADPRAAAIVALVQQDAERLAARVDPRPAIPMAVPAPQLRDAVPLALLGLALLVPVATAELLTPLIGEVILEPAERVDARAGLDLALASPLRQSLRELTKTDDEVAAAAREMLEILDALERGEIDRALALERLEQLEAELAAADERMQEELREDPAALADATRDLADAFETQELTADVGKALDRGDGEQAEQALSEAGAEAESSPDANEQLEQSLKEAERRLGKRADEREASETAKQLDEAERRLRREEKKKPETPAEAEEHERRLKKQRDQVEQLRRQHERELAAQKKVEELRRAAQQAAQSKAGSAERKRKLEQLGRGMKDASRSANGSQRMQGARDAVEEAKTFVRRAGQQGAGEERRRQQARRFDQAAKGQGDKDGQDGKGKDGKGKGKSTLLVEGQVGEGKPNGTMRMPGEGQGEGEGEGQGEGQGQAEGQGDGDGDGDGEGDGQGDGEGQGDGHGQGQAPGGDGIGEGSADPLGDPNAIAAHTKDVRVNAKRGRGVSKAEVLKDASQNGFATEPYRKMYQEYRDFAQSSLDSTAFPAAQRRLVKRYYQMIQAR